MANEIKFEASVYYGPGLWYSLHLDASEIESEKDEDYFIQRLKRLCRRHPCGNCSGHCKKYIEDNKPEKYKGLMDDKGNRIGLSKYMWAFHNFVNARLRKKQLGWEEYYSIYYINRKAVCSEECGEDHVVEELKKIAGANPFVKVIGT
jgi:hypothetical protein